MTIFGLSIYTVAAFFAVYTLIFIKLERGAGNLHKKLNQKRREVNAIIRRAESRKKIALPPAYQEENWVRSFYGEPTDENVILATTGCELSDAIFDAAHQAGIDIPSFYRQPLHTVLEREVSDETIHGHCSDSGRGQGRGRCLG